MANWWQNNCVHLTLDTTLTVSFLVSDFFMPNHFQQIIISNRVFPFHILHIHSRGSHNTYWWHCNIFCVILWRKFVLFSNELNSRYGYIFTIRKIAFVWYYEVLSVPPLAGEHIAFSSLGSIIFYDFGLPEISPIFIQLSLWYRVLVDTIPITVCHKY